MNGNRRAIDLVPQKGKPSKVYSIGGNCEKPNIDVVHAICSILSEQLQSDPSLITHHGTLQVLHVLHGTHALDLLVS